MKISDLKLIKKNSGKTYVSECGEWVLQKKVRIFNKKTGYGYKIKNVGHGLRIHVGNLKEAKKVIVDIINNDYIYEQLPSPLLTRAKELNPISVTNLDLSTKVWDLKKPNQHRNTRNEK